MTWVKILHIALQLAQYFARRAERNDIVEAVGNAIELSHKKRVDRAVAAGDDVLSGRVPEQPNDPNRRD